MKSIITLLLIVASFTATAQGTALKQDTAALRKEQEEVNKFITELVSKTTVRDFYQWLYDANVGTKDFESFTKLYNYFIQQKYLASKAPKK